MSTATPLTPGVPPEVKQGDIYWVHIPDGQTVGSEQRERRPWVIMSRTGVNRNGRNVVGVPLTSETRKANAYRIGLPVSQLIKEVTSGWTPIDSVALTDQTCVLDITRLERPRIGHLTDTAIAAVSLGLAYLFDIQ
jgi:mRNA-degrading endonuclease toxin of MazEF toxin-antitoxin module